MFVEPARTPYDWNFQILGFPVRVTWLFWVISAAWGYQWARGLDESYARWGWETPGLFALLLIWVGVSFVSILIHELGHTLAMRWFGQRSYIVLYHFGGLAIPENDGGWRRGYRRPSDQIIISAAGPLFQIVFGVVVASIAISMGLSIGSTANILDGWLPLPKGSLSTNATTTGLIDSAVYTSIFWAILNLLPVLPLDGGRIAQSLFDMHDRGSGLRKATILSIITSVLIALWAFQIENSALGMNFMILGIINYQSMNDPFSMR
jgi:stage IV sporulation protein FB